MISYIESFFVCHINALHHDFSYQLKLFQHFILGLSKNIFFLTATFFRFFQQEHLISRYLSLLMRLYILSFVCY